MRTPLIVANWKMNKSVRETETFARDLLPRLRGVTEVEIVVCPSFVSLPALERALSGSGIRVGAQNLFWERKGAYTGEISPLMLADAGCGYVILGHSERRRIMEENDAVINRKVRAALDADITPILCVGETLRERENHMAREVVQEQLSRGLKDIPFIPPGGMVIAYEPVWAIGTGVNASSGDAQEMIRFIRGCLARLYSEEQAELIRILYGGSVTPENIAEFMAEEDIDGALVGGASLWADSFAAIARFK